MASLVSFADVLAGGLGTSVVGGKGHQLALLAGLPLRHCRVPDGCVLTTAAFTEHVGALKIGGRYGSPGSATPAVLAQLRGEVKALELPASLSDGLTAFVAGVAARTRTEAAALRFAVRSSGTSEDGAAASFAGQYDSILNVEGTAGALVAAVKGVWASAFSEHLLTYLGGAAAAAGGAAAAAEAAEGGPLVLGGVRLPAMAVVVQLQIPSVASGVLFTLAPNASELPVFTIEGVWGQGEGLVSGEISPQTVTADWSTWPRVTITSDTHHHHHDDAGSAVAAAGAASSGGGTSSGGTGKSQLHKYACAATGGIALVDTTSEERAHGPLTAPTLATADGRPLLAALVGAGAEIAKARRFPQDVEWCTWGGQLYVVQTRPVTRHCCTATNAQGLVDHPPAGASATPWPPAPAGAPAPAGPTTAAGVLVAAAAAAASALTGAAATVATAATGGRPKRHLPPPSWHLCLASAGHLLDECVVGDAFRSFLTRDFIGAEDDDDGASGGGAGGGIPLTASMFDLSFGLADGAAAAGGGSRVMHSAGVVSLPTLRLTDRGLLEEAVHVESAPAAAAAAGPSDDLYYGSATAAAAAPAADATPSGGAAATPVAAAACTARSIMTAAAVAQRRVGAVHPRGAWGGDVDVLSSGYPAVASSGAGAGAHNAHDVAGTWAFDALAVITPHAPVAAAAPAAAASGGSRGWFSFATRSSPAASPTSSSSSSGAPASTGVAPATLSADAARTAVAAVLADRIAAPAGSGAAASRVAVVVHVSQPADMRNVVAAVRAANAAQIAAGGSPRAIISGVIGVTKPSTVATASTAPASWLPPAAASSAPPPAAISRAASDMDVDGGGSSTATAPAAGAAVTDEAGDLDGGSSISIDRALVCFLAPRTPELDAAFTKALASAAAGHAVVGSGPATAAVHWLPCATAAGGDAAAAVLSHFDVIFHPQRTLYGRCFINVAARAAASVSDWRVSRPRTVTNAVAASTEAYKTYIHPQVEAVFEALARRTVEDGCPPDAPAQPPVGEAAKPLVLPAGAATSAACLRWLRLYRDACFRSWSVGHHAYACEEEYTEASTRIATAARLAGVNAADLLTGLTSKNALDELTRMGHTYAAGTWPATAGDATAPPLPHMRSLPALADDGGLAADDFCTAVLANTSAALKQACAAAAAAAAGSSSATVDPLVTRWALFAADFLSYLSHYAWMSSENDEDFAAQHWGEYPRFPLTILRRVLQEGGGAALTTAAAAAAAGAAAPTAGDALPPVGPVGGPVLRRATSVASGDAYEAARTVLTEAMGEEHDFWPVLDELRLALRQKEQVHVQYVRLGLVTKLHLADWARQRWEAIRSVDASASVDDLFHATPHAWVTALQRDDEASLAALVHSGVIRAAHSAMWAGVGKSPSLVPFGKPRVAVHSTLPAATTGDDGMPVGPSPNKGAEYSGLGVSAGTSGGPVVGRARVILTLSDAHKVKKGEILITKTTNPAWSPLFSLLGGLVLEEGGMLSHGAVVARECGIPAISQVCACTRIILNGALVEIDGAAGTLKVLS